MSYTPPATGNVARVNQLPFATTITPNSNTTDVVRVTLTGNTIVNVPSGQPLDGDKMEYQFTQDATGGRTVTFASGYGYGDTITTVTIGAAANKTTIVGLEYNANIGKWLILAVSTGF